MPKFALRHYLASSGDGRPLAKEFSFPQGKSRKYCYFFQGERVFL